MEQQLYTKQETAEYLRCSVKTIERRIARGELVKFKNGRLSFVLFSSILDFIKRNTKGRD